MQARAGHLPGIESLRAYAALATVVFHVIWLTGIVVPPRWEFMKWYFGQGVPLFFVVSAFSLAFGYFDKLDSARQVRHFYVRRLFRIAPLFYACLVFQLLLLKLHYGVTMPWRDVAMNVLFLFNLLPQGVDGIVPASWSIGVEMLFYAMFPVLVAVCRSMRATLLLSALAMFCAGNFALAFSAYPNVPAGLLQHGVLMNLPLFCCGLIAYHGYRLVPASAGPWILGAGLASLLGLYLVAPQLMAWAASQHVQIVYVTAWGVCFGLICLGMAISPVRLLSNRVSRYLGKISFSIYLVHANVIIALNENGVFRALWPRVPGEGTLDLFASIVLVVLVVVPLAGLLYRLIEEPGIALGKRVLAQRKPSAQPAMAVAAAGLAQVSGRSR